MAKHSTKKERNKTQPFVQIKRWEYQSPAIQALTGDQFKIYFDMRSCYNGRNNGYIIYSSRRAGECVGKSHQTGARALDRLAQLGFIKVTKNYAYCQKRKAREYELTAIAREPASKENRLPDGTKDFLRWTQASIDRLLEQDNQAKKRRKKTKHSSMGGHSPQNIGQSGAKIIQLRAKS